MIASKIALSTTDEPIGEATVVVSDKAVSTCSNWHVVEQ